MAVAPDIPSADLTLGPVLYNWRPETWRDFYLRIADEAPVSAVYLGEVICSKRAPLFARHVAPVADRLERGGKAVIFSTLAEVVTRLDRQLVESVCASPNALIEANDVSALAQLRGRAYHVGPYINAYNEHTLAFLASEGARSFCLSAELPAAAITQLCTRAAALDVRIEVQVFGRIPLALSARCYHARAHGRTKDNCQFVCESDPDGLDLHTLDGRPMLAINGIQTQSYGYLNLIRELSRLREMGVSRFRLSPHSCDIVAVASIFRASLDRNISPAEAAARIEALKLPGYFLNGFFHGRPGYYQVDANP